MPTWKRGGYQVRMYMNDHPPRHVHIFRDREELDRFDIENWQFMDGTIGSHYGRVLKILDRLALEGGFD